MSFTLSDSPSATSTDHDPRAAALTSSLIRLRAVLDEYRFNPDEATEAELRQTVRTLAAQVADWPLRGQQHEIIGELCQAVRVLWASGLVNLSPPAEDLQIAEGYASRGWPGLLAATLLAPAWASPFAPRLAKVPDWLWGDFMHWVMTPPTAALRPGMVDAHFAQLTAHLDELAGWMERNRGSAAVRAAGEAFLDLASQQTPLLATSDLKAYTMARARLIRAIARTRSGDSAPLAATRNGRALHVGLLARSFADGSEMDALLPVLRGLDPQRIELICFAATRANGPAEAACRQLAREFHVLPASREERLALCGGAGCDVLLYASDLVGVTDEFTGLAVQRLAPVQAVLPDALLTTGFELIDLRLCPEATVEPSTERLALLPGWKVWHAEGNAGENESEPLRAEFGLPARGPVLVTAARPEFLSAEILEVWTKLLKAQPEAALLLLLPADADPFLAEELPARFTRIGGVDPTRIIVVLGDRNRAMKLGDVYLDTHPTADLAALAAAVQARVPAVTWSGQTHRGQTSAALLIGLNAMEQVAIDADGYVDVVLRLISDTDYRRAVLATQRQGWKTNLRLTDNLGTADALTALLEKAFDEQVAGRRRADKTPLKLAATAAAIAAQTKLCRAALEHDDAAAAWHESVELLALAPYSSEARRLHARALHVQGRHERALEYALAGLAGHESDVGAWIDVAESLRINGRNAEAIEAYEAALKLDASCAHAWAAIAELAASAGQVEFAKEARATATALQSTSAQPVPVR